MRAVAPRGRRAGRRSMRARMTSWTVTGMRTLSSGRRSTTRPSSWPSTPSSSSERTTSSRKNGLPSARASTRAVSSGGSASVSSAACAIRSLSRSSSGASASVRRLSPPSAGAYPGRDVTISRMRASPIRRARCASTRSDCSSTQCRSSPTSTSGRSCACRRNSSQIASRMPNWRSSGSRRFTCSSPVPARSRNLR